MRKRIFNVLNDLAEGFYRKNNLGEADLENIYQASLFFLFRLLFILYAESRGMLPVKPFTPGYNRQYHERYSLSRLINKLRDRDKYAHDAFTELYEELLRLFQIINGNEKDQNQVLNVTRYNGGLFDPKNCPVIQNWRIGDQTMANVLRQLMFVQPPARANVQQQIFETNETVDYSSLEVRQLGDIYEGLLGGRYVARPGAQLELVDENGENHQKGIFYTPDWVVRFLIEQTLRPLLDKIASLPEVQAALKAQSNEKKQNDAFAQAVLKLAIVDPAMGSGHFLVRATEFLAEEIMYHPTTRLHTEQIVTSGAGARTKADILAKGLIPIPPGVPHEQAENAYWRRRIVESCIYGVDINAMAVELAKLSLWLTCIAVEEPLNFLDHHLREGNSLISVTPEEAHRPPFVLNEDEKQVTIDVGSLIADTLRYVIDETVNISMQASTEMELVKQKENRWRIAQEKLQPYRDVLYLWLAMQDKLTVDGRALTAFDYQLIALNLVDPYHLNDDDLKKARHLWEAVVPAIHEKMTSLQPFNWQLEFPAVFYSEDGALKPEEERGFDAVLGNPPYISTHTSSEERWRDILEKRMRYLDDLYVHFTDLGFRLLRQGGRFGFIVSDTFFTLSTKLRMREWLQSYRLDWLGQCDPFNATVDAAVFAAEKTLSAEDDSVQFVQARYRTKTSQPERELPLITAKPLSEEHSMQGCLRLHRVPISLYQSALKRAFLNRRLLC